MSDATNRSEPFSSGHEAENAAPATSERGEAIERVAPSPPPQRQPALQASPLVVPATSGIFCRGCGNRINPSTVICPSCGVATGETSPVSQQEAQMAHQRRASMATMQQKSASLAIVLSLFFPGVGQLYAGAAGKGIMFIAFSVINFTLMLTVLGAIIGVPLQFLNWLISMVNASGEVTRHNVRLMATL